MKVLFAVILSMALLLPLPVLAADQSDLMQKIDNMSRELDSLKQQLNEIKKNDSVREQKISVIEKKAEKSSAPSWLEIGGDYRFRVDSLRGKIPDYIQYNPLTSAPWQPAPGYPFFLSDRTAGFTVKNETLLLNRFGLNLKAHATEDVTVKARLLMYKVWGHETETPVAGNFFADRAFGAFDGVIGHVPSDNALRVDQAFATWSNIGGAPVWFSVGRRPSTGGVPTNLRQNAEKVGNGGIPGILVDYAFDGLTLGVAPDIDKLPGAYAKVCYGRGFDSGFKRSDVTNSIKDTDFLGIQVVPVDTDDLHVELQWQRGFNIFNVPSDGVNLFGQFQPVTTNLGDIDWYGGVVMKNFEKVGPGNLSLFASGAISSSHPNDNLMSLPFFFSDPTNPMGSLSNGGFGLLYDQGGKKSHNGNAFYLGGRYDFTATGTKLGLEYNHGSKYWIGMVPASDDLWTSKLGTRGDVYEAYVIQELKQKLISKKGKAFFRLGYQYYNFDYTGSNNWVGEPKKISSLNTMDPSGTQLLAPVKNAHDIYFSFDVTF